MWMKTCIHDFYKRDMGNTAVDTSGQTKDAELVAEIISKCVNQVGPENVVLVVTDNAAHCVRASIFSSRRNSIHTG